MQTVKFNFELTAEDTEHLEQHLRKYLTDAMMNIMDCMASDKDEATKKSVIAWYIGNAEYFLGIIKKMGFDPHFDDTLTRLKQRHNLTNDVSTAKSGCDTSKR